MAAKSPTTSVKSREIIGEDQFSKRREVFDKHDTVFLPLPSPTNMITAHKELDQIITSNHAKTTSNFKRNTPGYSSMRETRNEERNHFDFRPRKYSDNFTSELNYDDDVDYRHRMTERTRRLSKLRRDFLTSNLHEPTTENPFARAGTRASLPAKSASPISYKIESPNLYKFPFAEPYATPTPTRKVVLDLGPSEVDGGKENQDPSTRNKYQSLPNNGTATKIDHQKLFDELVKRYSPHRKPIDWKLPPTRPRVVGSVPKPNSSTTDSVDSSESKLDLEDKPNKTGDDDVFDIKEKNIETKADCQQKPEDEIIKQSEIIQNGIESATENKIEITVSEVTEKVDVTKETDSKISLTELAEKNDEVPELSTVQRQISKESTKRAPLEFNDLTIPALIEKMSAEGEASLDNNKGGKKVKRKRSFLDKLFGRKKEK